MFVFSRRWFLPFVLVAAFACSEQKSTPAVEATAPTQPPPDTVATTTPEPAAAPVAADTSDVQDVAAFIAGLPVKSSSELRAYATRPEWQRFAADAEQSWRKYHSTRTDKIEAWAQQELDSVRRNSPVVFYPFSGPDFLNATTMLPGSSTYVLVGLEPVGSVPSRASLENPKLFNAIKTSLWSVLSFSFFSTNSMAVDLKSVELDGALPLIMLFAARTDHQVIDVRNVQLNRAGELASVDSVEVSAKPKPIPGVEINLRGPDGQEKKVYYFSADLSDWKLSQTNAAILRYVRSLGPLTTYVKSATYLMHKAYFSQVRNLILERSRYILQDDSGIAMKYFKPSDWHFTHYGTYRKPIPMFAMYYQPALTAAYQDSLNKAKPLPFGTGYNWRVNDSNLLLASRRGELLP
ncbi:hypothetical protein F0P96_19880 [Hymenobacter busanensis]|uniref:Uncharacterized protein n=1 Tax=Hymenobacter busanensis TaxID=2607656 RepID=A0A7L4ZW71_9BACT|nr:hypothetical protein [Hymenobacter busanensis]KAA9325589.1 hypothetical protein F0P96_19880 [Hymenobacter busanensis]QHJ07739.1 hypothetical protein GUY19_10785 [Hymenobacter busanensis]